MQTHAFLWCATILLNIWVFAKEYYNDTIVSTVTVQIEMTHFIQFYLFFLGMVVSYKGYYHSMFSV